MSLKSGTLFIMMGRAENSEPSRLRHIGIALLGLPLLAIGCSGAEPSSSVITTVTVAAAPLGMPVDSEGLVPLAGSGWPADDFIGLSEKDAVSLAAERGYAVRILRRDTYIARVILADANFQRVNLEIVDDRVIDAARF